MSAELTRAETFAQEMKSSNALLTAWEKTLARGKDSTAIFDTNGAGLRTFREIETRARAFESKFDMFGAGSVVAIQIGNHEDWPAIFVACLRRKLVILPLEQSISTRQRDAALEICKVSGVVAAGVSAGRSPEVLPMRTSAATTHWNESPPSLLKLTSGTTAAPRAIRFQSEQLLADCEQICETMGITDLDLNFGVIPISHSYGFSNLLTPLIGRGVPMVLSNERLPRSVLVDLARTNATVLPGMPLFYQAFSEMESVPALPKLRLCISAGAPLSAVVAK
jgi:long-chain acyl-CoA synthetase